MKTLKTNHQKAVSGFDDVAVTKLRNAARGDQDFFYAMLSSNKEGLGPSQIAEKIKMFGLN
jgi:Mg2+-importing ATPase